MGIGNPTYSTPGDSLSRELAKQYASRFICRSDVKAVQLDKAGGGLGPGDWFPDTRINIDRRPNSPHLPVGFSMDHLLAHIAGERTYGHYLLSPESEAKLFVFDIDISTCLDKDTGKYTGTWVDFDSGEVHNQVNPLLLWGTRTREAAPARAWLKYQLKLIGHRFADEIRKIGVDTAVAYSGHKGIHVYGFTGKMSASEVRDGALLVMDRMGEFEPYRGQNFWRHKNPEPEHGFQNFSIEVFPKQTSLEGKSLGNLVRLPLGVNHKAPKDPTFFLDMRAPLAQFTPHPDPVGLLKKGNPFE